MTTALQRFLDYYIKGHYHCEGCPFCWGGEYLPGCDEYADCGCYIKGDIQDTCRLLPPVRFLLGWGKRKKAQYHQNHEYDDFGKWYEEKLEKEERLDRALRDYFRVMGYGLVFADKDGRVVPVNGEYITLTHCYDLYRLASDCEDIFGPVKYVPLKQRWKELLKDTWDRFLMIFKPYFCK